jgi:Uma2 family endonuclease
MTVEEFVAISEADPRPVELIDGEVVVLSHPRMAHVFRRSVPGLDYYDVGLELRETLTSPLLPGFELALSELFEP